MVGISFGGIACSPFSIYFECLEILWYIISDWNHKALKEVLGGILAGSKDSRGEVGEVDGMRARL